MGLTRPIFLLFALSTASYHVHAHAAEEQAIPTLTSTSSSLCNTEYDDIRLYGGSGDAGRVEVCYESSWRYLCVESESDTDDQNFEWSKANAGIVCRQLGYSTAFMARPASEMSMGTNVDSGIDSNIAGVLISSCNFGSDSTSEVDTDEEGPDSTLFTNCNLTLSRSCSIDNAVAVACSTGPAASSLTSHHQSKKLVEIQKFVDETILSIAAWEKKEEEEVQREHPGHSQRHISTATGNNPICSSQPANHITETSESLNSPGCANTNALVGGLSSSTKSASSSSATISSSIATPLPNPFEDEKLLNEAFVFPNEVITSYSVIKESFKQKIKTKCKSSTESVTVNDCTNDDTNIMTTTNVMGIIDTNETASEDSRGTTSSDIYGPTVGAYGLDLTNILPSDLDLSQAEFLFHHSERLKFVRNLYLSSNSHNGLHWFLDAPYRYYTKPEIPTITRSAADEETDDKITPFMEDPVAKKLFDTLQRDGFVPIDNFGGDIDSIIQMAEESLLKEALLSKTEKKKKTVAVTGGGSVLTSRVSIPPIHDILAHNSTIAAVVNAYQGPSILSGYKVTRLTKALHTTDQYIAGE